MDLIPLLIEQMQHMDLGGQMGQKDHGHGDGDPEEISMTIQEPMHHGKTAAMTDEQQSLVAELLELQGRQDEIPRMLDPNTQNEYLKELNSVQNNHQPVPPLQEPGNASTGGPPPGADPGMGAPPPGGGMGGPPPPDGAPPGMVPPGQDAASMPPGQIDPSQPGGGQPPMQPMSGKGRLVRRPGQPRTADANNRVPRCPNCGSATTSLMDGNDSDTGDKRARCHSCDTIFTPKEPKEGHRLVALQGINPVGQHPVDETGAPLEIGSDYELSNNEFPEPLEHVTLVAQEGDRYGFRLAGEIGVGMGPENQAPDFWLTSDQIRTGEYHFTPVQSSSDQQLPPEGGSTSPGMAPSQVPPLPTTDQNQDVNPGTGVTAAAPNWHSGPVRGDGSITPSEEPMDWCPHCHQQAVNSWGQCEDCGNMIPSPDDAWNPAQAMGLGRLTPHQGAAEAQQEQGDVADQLANNEDNEYQGEENNDQYHSSHAHLAWINGDSDDDDFYANIQRHAEMRATSGSRNLADIAAKDSRLQEIKERLDGNARTAGRHFSPSEQKALINEKGTARNADLLDLSNTHYESRYIPEARPDRVPDSHSLF